MKITTKVLMLSAFVFPGAGHIALQCYRSAIIYMAVATIALYFLVSISVQKALVISNQIMSGEVDLRGDDIFELISEQLLTVNSQLVELATVVFLLVWLVSIVDSYRIARGR